MSWDDISRWIGTWDWGAFPEYLGAVGTVGAVAAALHIAGRDGKRFEHEQAIAVAERHEAAQERAEAAREREDFRKEREEMRQRAKREVAEKVTLFSPAPDTHQRPAAARAEARRTLKVQNSSNSPIYGVTVTSESESGDHALLGFWPSIPPGGSASVRRIPGYYFDSGEYALIAYFEDGRGQFWSRDTSGVLIEMTYEEWTREIEKSNPGLGKILGREPTPGDGPTS